MRLGAAILGMVGALALIVLGAVVQIRYGVLGKLAQHTEACPHVLIDARDPATGAIITFASPCEVPEGWDQLETDHEFFAKGSETWSRYRNDDLGVRFEYRVSPEGYTLVQQATSSEALPTLVEHVQLFPTKEFLELSTSTVPREGPPSIGLMVFDDPKGLEPRAWVKEESAVSNIALATGAPRAIDIGGVPAIRYTYDGLYPTDVIVALNNGRIYLLFGSYLAPSDAIHKDLDVLIKALALY